MKNKAEKILFLLFLTCSSCSSIYRFSVDVQEPALITIPVSAQNVLILNNTIIQPNNYGIERIIDGQTIPTDYPLALDSTVQAAIEEISVVLEESNFFNSIHVLKKQIREDSEWLTVKDLSPELQQILYDTKDFDAMLVVNRLLFSITENVKILNRGFFSSATLNMRIDGSITCSMYYYENEKPLTTFTVSDSLFVKSKYLDHDSISLFKEIPEKALDILSRNLGNQAAKRFIPTWKTSNRHLFTGFNPRMQEAVSYAADRQWTIAETIWIAELENKTKIVDKAKIAFNLAITNEMQDKFEQALEWAKKANEYFKNANPDKYQSEIKLSDKYILELERRIQNNHLLDLQWGKE